MYIDVRVYLLYACLVGMQAPSNTFVDRARTGPSILQYCIYLHVASPEGESQNIQIVTFKNKE